MANLRSYLHEIESHLEQNQYDQAIAHCQQILKKYSNYVQALRLLGQAYLENKQIPESIDCFEKVIAIIPDDFVTHVAFSAIKEDERDLDAAIFHMELAFDSQPSNNIVQDELKRLIGKRDGAVPDKINLSRGALIRMYAKGELFQQAINEINAALSVNPLRIDLKILQADMLLKSNGAVQSAEICNQVLESHPFCLRANEILHQIYIENGLTENAKTVLDRLTAVDPYYGWTVSLDTSVDEVPDEKVEIERLEYESAFSTSSFDTWDQSKPGENSDEFTAISKNESNTAIIEPESSATGPFNSVTSDFEFNSDADTTGTYEESPEDGLPEFMKGAGWRTSTTPEVGPPPDVYDNQSTEAEKTDLPDWLKVKASDSFIVNSTVSYSLDDDNLEPSETNSLLEPDLNNDISSEQQSENQTFNSEVIMSDDNYSASDPKDENSDWMAQFFDEAKNEQQPSDADKDLPDWLNNFGKEEPSEEKSDEELPAWLNSLDPNIDEKKSVPDTPSIDFDSILSDLASQPMDDNPVEIDPNVEDQSDTPTLNEEDISLRLDRFTQASETSTSSTLSEPEVPAAISEQPVQPEVNENVPIQSFELDEEENQIPDWVKSVLTEPEIADSSPVDVKPPEVTNEVPPSMEKTDIVEDTISETEGAISAATSDELLGWLREISPEHEETNESEVVNAPAASELESIISEPMDDALDRLKVLSTEETPVSESLDAPMDTAEDETLAQPVESLKGLESEPTIFETPETIEEEISVPFASEEISETVETEITSTLATDELEVEQQPEANFSDEITQLIDMVKNGQYEEALLHPVLSESSENDQENILNVIQELKPAQESDFNFMQFLGDILAKSNRFDEALEAYTRAEELLTQKLE